MNIGDLPQYFKFVLHKFCTIIDFAEPVLYSCLMLDFCVFIRQLTVCETRSQMKHSLTKRSESGKFMARRRDCSETVIAMTFLAANLIRWQWNTETLLLSRFRTILFMERELVIIPFLRNAAWPFPVQQPLILHIFQWRRYKSSIVFLMIPAIRFRRRYST